MEVIAELFPLGYVSDHAGYAILRKMVEHLQCVGGRISSCPLIFVPEEDPAGWHPSCHKLGFHLEMAGQLSFVRGRSSTGPTFVPSCDQQRATHPAVACTMTGNKPSFPPSTGLMTHTQPSFLAPSCRRHENENQRCNAPRQAQFRGAVFISMEHIFFENWESLVRTGVITVMAYTLLIFLLRCSGKRTLSKMNAFDLIITIALGSTLATVMLSKDVPLADGILALALLICLQYAITYLSVRYKFVNNLVKSTPSLLVYKGQILANVMRKERISIDEIHAIIREKGLAALADADAIVLETDGTLTVIKQVPDDDCSSLKNVSKPDNIVQS